MIKLIVLLYFVFNTCSARPNIDTQNLVTVPPNCPNGQEWINGQCRDVWRVTAAPTNVVTAPTNCPVGQEFVNGQCRDVWYRIRSKLNDIGTVPSDSENLVVLPQNLVTVPPNCRPGQQWVNGACKDVWRSFSNSKNVITVPTNCAPGEEYINGQCREVWRSSMHMVDSYVNSLRKVLLYRQVRQVENVEEIQEKNPINKNVIGVPSQCPAGFRPDALGICREIIF